MQLVFWNFTFIPVSGSQTDNRDDNTHSSGQQSEYVLSCPVGGSIVFLHREALLLLSDVTISCLQVVFVVLLVLVSLVHMARRRYILSMFVCFDRDGDGAVVKSFP